MMGDTMNIWISGPLFPIPDHVTSLYLFYSNNPFSYTIRFGLSTRLLGFSPGSKFQSAFLVRSIACLKLCFWSRFCSGFKNWDFLLLARNSGPPGICATAGVHIISLISRINLRQPFLGQKWTLTESIWFDLIRFKLIQYNSSTGDTCFETSSTLGTIQSEKQRMKMQNKDKLSHINIKFSASPFLSTLTSNKLDSPTFSP